MEITIIGAEIGLYRPVGGSGCMCGMVFFLPIHPGFIAHTGRQKSHHSQTEKYFPAGRDGHAVLCPPSL